MITRNFLHYSIEDIDAELANDNVLSTLWEELKVLHDKWEPLDVNLNFEYIGSGSYKEAYKYTSPINKQQFIVKMCTIENDTIEEAKLLSAVLDHEIEGFVPTIFLPISTCYGGYMDCGDTYNEEFDEWEATEPEFSCIEIQEICTPISEIPEVERHFLPNKEKLCRRFDALYHRKYFPIAYTQWIRDYISAYGNEAFSDFTDFLCEYGVSDLHCENIGYLNGKPIIFDWLS